MLRYVMAWGLGGVGGAITFMWVAYTSDATLRLHHGLGFGSLCGAITWLAYTSDATLRLRHGLGFGWWGGATAFMWLAYTSDATIRLRHGLGFGSLCGAKTFMWLAHTSDAMLRLRHGVSSLWSTRKIGAVNLQLLQGIRIWQWGWHHGNS